jgi:hypothetical protein
MPFIYLNYLPHENLHIEQKFYFAWGLGFGAQIPKTSSIKLKNVKKTEK